MQGSQQTPERQGIGTGYMRRASTVLALMLSGMEMTATNTQMTFKHLEVSVHMDTITRMLEYCSTILS